MKSKNRMVLLMLFLLLAFLLTGCTIGEDYFADMGAKIGQTVKDKVSQTIDGAIEESTQKIKEDATEKIDGTLAGVSEFVAGKMVPSPDEIMWTSGNIQYSIFWENEEMGEKIEYPIFIGLDSKDTDDKSAPYNEKIKEYLDTKVPIQVVSDGAIITLEFFENLPETVVIRRDENIVKKNNDIYIEPYEIETKEMENPLTGRAMYSFSNYYSGATTACYIADCTFVDGEEIEIAFLVVRE